jgi:vitamin B12 transporter
VKSQEFSAFAGIIFFPYSFSPWSVFRHHQKIGIRIMRRKFYTYTAIAALLSISTATIAQDTSNTNHLNEVVVTASRFAQKQGETGKVITVITREYLEKNSGKSLTSILNNQAGIMVNGAENNLGSNQEVYMRGATTGNTLILIDGIPVSDASAISNAFDLNFIAPEQIERIEILKGSQSTIYGSDAVAGVINIITRKAGDKKIGVQANASYGSYNTYQGNAALNGTINKFSYILGYKYEKSDGFSSAHDSLAKIPARDQHFDKDGLEQNSVFAKLGFQATERWSLRYQLLTSDYRTDLDAGAFTDDKNYTVHNKYLLNTIASKYDFNKGSWNILYSFQRNKRHLLNDSTLASDNRNYFRADYGSDIHQVETYVKWDINETVQFIGGGNYTFTKMDQQAISFSAYGPYVVPPLRGDSARTKQSSMYASLLLHNLGGFNLELGGRFNTHNIYGENQTISFSPSYLINEHHKVFINMASAYKVPTLYQLYSEYGNSALKPEATTSYEVGYQASVFQNKLNFRVVGFQRDSRDIIFFYSDPVTYAGKYINADKQMAQGVEVEADWNITNQLNFTMNYTYVDGKITQKGPVKDTTYNNLYRRPRHALNANLGYQATPALYVSAQFKAIGKRWEELYGTSPESLASYYTIDLYGEYKVCKGVKIFADFRNITDQEYFTIRGYNNRKFNFNTGIVCNF